MNCLQYLFQNNNFKKYLPFFSIAMFFVGGIAWACSDDGYGDDSYSSFSPEAFVAKEYSPFFYTPYVGYYTNDVDNNNRFNEQVVQDWYTYFNKKISKNYLEALILHTSYSATDSVYKYWNGQIKYLKPGLPNFKVVNTEKKLTANFFNYLLLAKACEAFAVKDQYDWWDEKPKAIALPLKFESDLMKAFSASGDPFIKQRLWFQVVRYYYFASQADDIKTGKNGPKLLSFFNRFKDQYPHNLIYTRALAYTAGYYYNIHNYAQSNYIYSLCYDFSFETKIPNKWSFRPQEEKDWRETLALAKTSEEKITLWHLLGLYFDESRAIKEIYALNPKSNKLDVLLSRLINIYEQQGYFEQYDTLPNRKPESEILEQVGHIASANNTSNPAYWNLAAGYLYMLNKNLSQAKKFYDAAAPQVQSKNRLLSAQYKILNWTLYLQNLKKINRNAETEMTEPLNWLADLKAGKDTIASLRFSRTLNETLEKLSKLYLQQNDSLKAEMFKNDINYYVDNNRIEKLKAFLSKPAKSPFENAIIRYYELKLSDLLYHQAVVLTYQEDIDGAIEKMKGSGDTTVLFGNPFNSRLNDCHDCDHEAPQKKKYTALSFLESTRELKEEIKTGKNLFRNNFLLANAYYNISYYGNARVFYQSPITGLDASHPTYINTPFQKMLTSSAIAEKYYLAARNHAQTEEQKAKCTFMASKCERNSTYNTLYFSPDYKQSYPDFIEVIPTGKYFSQLKTQYSNTKYYQEILQECGYFKRYADGVVK